MIRCIAMLTHHDVTVPNAMKVFEENKHAKAEYWGFKDIGVTLQEGEELIKAMQGAGKHVFIEPITTDESEANRWADLGLKYKVDGVLGLFYPSVAEKMKNTDVLFLPGFGRRNEKMELLGTLECITRTALDIVDAGAGGVRVSAYRWIEGDPIVLIKHLKAELEKRNVPFMMTGSVNDFSKLDVVREMQPWGITVGGALFEDGKFGGGTVAERIDRIDAYCND